MLPIPFFSWKSFFDNQKNHFHSFSLINLPSFPPRTSKILWKKFISPSIFPLASEKSLPSRRQFTSSKVYSLRSNAFSNVDVLLFPFSKKKNTFQRNIFDIYISTPTLSFKYTNIAKTILKFNVNRADTQNFEITFISPSSNSSQNTFLQILKLKNVPLHYEQKLVLVFFRRSFVRGCQHTWIFQKIRTFSTFQRKIIWIDSLTTTLSF